MIGWNKDEARIFKRAATSLQLNFRLCHPKESLDKVVQIVDEMKSGAPTGRGSGSTCR